jgi:hypothetical protein
MTKENYEFILFYHIWYVYTSTLICPCCGSLGLFSRHGVYTKYYYVELIQILRVRCKTCRHTHALIPSFSVPGGSFGMEEVETYFQLRHRGFSRRNAGVQLLERGVSGAYLRYLDHALDLLISRAKAMLWAEGNPYERALSWIYSCSSEAIGHPLCWLNRRSLQSGYNPLWHTRTSLLVYPRSSSGKLISHNPLTMRKTPCPIHSP